MCVKVFTALAALFLGAGALTIATHITAVDPSLLIGLTMSIIGTMCIATSSVLHYTRSLEDEFDAGYAAGYRKGRRVAKPVVLHLDNGRRHAVVPQTPFGAVASNDSAS